MPKDRLSRMAKLTVVLLVLLVVTAGPLIAERLSKQDTVLAANPVLRFGGTGVATTTTYGGKVWPTTPGIEPAVSEIFMLMTEPTVNTATVTLQISPTGANWFTHTTSGSLWSNVVTNTSAVTRINVEGQVFRIIVTVANTETLTPTFYVVTH